MALSLFTAPIVEPLTWAQCQKQIRQEGLDDDKTFVETIVIPAARERAEIATRRAVQAQTWDLTLDTFSDDWIEIPKPPLVSVTHVKYVNTTGTLTTLTATTDYVVEAPAGPRCARGRITLPYGMPWPAPRAQANAVTIRFVCGYTTVPPLLLQAMLMDVGALYEARESIIVSSAGTAAAIPLPMFSGWIYRSFRSMPRKR